MHIHLSFLDWWSNLSNGLGPPPNIGIFAPDAGALCGEEWLLFDEFKGEFEILGEERRGPGHADGEKSELDVKQMQQRQERRMIFAW